MPVVGAGAFELLLAAARGERSEPGLGCVQIDELYTRWPFYGSRRIADELGVNRKRIQRLMRLMGIEAIYPKKRTTRPGAGHKIYPYLLRNVEATMPDQVWSSDITYVPLQRGWLYLTAVMDWFSRKVLELAIVEHARRPVLLRSARRGALRWARRRCSTPTRAASSRPGRSRTGWNSGAWRSAWTAAAERSTTCSSSGCGEA